MIMRSKAVFLDKDGTLIPDIPYNVDPDKITLSAGAAQALRKLIRLNYLIFIVSNQSGIARGYFTERDLARVIAKIASLLWENMVPLSGFYYCPHDPRGKVPQFSVSCNCKKPMPGMILKACEDHNLDLDHSWFLGDVLDDMEAGNRAGCRTVLIDNGHETEWLKGLYRIPDFIVRNLTEAADIISYGLIS